MDAVVVVHDKSRLIKLFGCGPTIRNDEIAGFDMRLNQTDSFRDAARFAIDRMPFGPYQAQHNFADESAALW